MKRKGVFIVIISCVIILWFIFVVKESIIQAEIDSANSRLVGQNIVDIPPVVDTTNFTTNPVSIENIDNSYYKITLDFNCGLTHKEMGELLGKKIKNTIPNYDYYCDQILANYASMFVRGSGVHRNSLEDYIEDTKILMKKIDKDYADELEGMAAQLCTTNESRLGDKKLSKYEFLFINFFQELVRKTNIRDKVTFGNKNLALSIYGDKTVDGKNIAGVNIELDCSALKALSAVTIYKHGNKSFCNIGFAGLMGVNSAFNDDKVFVTLIDTQIDKKINTKRVSDDVRSISFDLRYALENNTTMNAAILYIKDEGNNYYDNNIIFFSDTKTSKVLENDKRFIVDNKKREVRTSDSNLVYGILWGIPDSVAAVNSFLLKEDDKILDEGDKNRIGSLREKIKEKDSIDFEYMKEVMSFTHLDKNISIGSAYDGSLLTTKTIQSIVFKPVDMKLEVAFTPPIGDIPIKPNFRVIPIDFK